MKIQSRKSEQKILEELILSKKAEFLAIYGRRRIGKTYLIKNYFKDRGVFFHITGVPKETKINQIRNFYDEFIQTFKLRSNDESKFGLITKSWQEAFSSLQKVIKNYPGNKKIIIFLDELPWLASKKSGFLEALSYQWNRHFESDPRIVLIVCGSAASWMIKNVINSKGGLYLRLTKKISLKPFNLCETKQYLEGKNIVLSNKQIVEIYMAIGGVAKYLDLIKPGKSSAQIISDICFSSDSILHNEFENLFKSLFSNSAKHIEVIKVLNKNMAGMNLKEIVKEAKIKSGSVQKKVLTELLESGFIAKSNNFKNKSKESIYRLSDPYSSFYLKWIAKLNFSIALQENYWLRTQNSHAWNSWAGYIFEIICLNHIPQIAKALGIHGINYSATSYRYFSKSKSDSGFQIDLLIDRSDNCINLCEIKFYNDEFILTKNYAQELEYKRRRFVSATGTKKTVFYTLITAHGARENSYYNELIANQLSLDDLFRD